MKTIALILAILARCAAQMPARADAADRFADLERFPQSADAYLPMDPDGLITDFSNQQVYAEEFLRNHFAPWENDDLSYLGLTLDMIIDFHKAAARKRYYSENGAAYPRASLAEIAANGALDPDASPRSGVVLADTDVRVLPTSVRLFSSRAAALGESGRLRLDELQVSAVKPGEPIAIFGVSKDSNWLFAATGAVTGWIRAKNAAIADDDFKDAYMYSTYSVTVRDNLEIGGEDGKRICAVKLGAVLPRNGGDLLLPVRGCGGMAAIRRYTPPAGAAAAFPVPFTPRNASAVIDQMMAERYGWGGAGGLRDCSLMTKDYFSVFGVWLPRNSGDQAKAGAVVPLGNTPSKGRAGAIVSNAVPYATLIHMPGHIMLYIGLYDGEPAVFHNTWGVRTKTGRAVVGRAVASGLRLGVELPGKAEGSLLIDRIDSLVFPIANIRTK
ncbi:MAG: SH3 domain-containing protein [Synergistaceae bacterium]|nr:SH3 domain-containing protein [Synergistaceae bacterium]